MSKCFLTSHPAFLNFTLRTRKTEGAAALPPAQRAWRPGEITNMGLLLAVYSPSIGRHKLCSILCVIFKKPPPPPGTIEPPPRIVTCLWSPSLPGSSQVASPLRGSTPACPLSHDCLQHPILSRPVQGYPSSSWSRLQRQDSIGILQHQPRAPLTAHGASYMPSLVCIIMTGSVRTSSLPTWASGAAQVEGSPKSSRSSWRTEISPSGIILLGVDVEPEASTDLGSFCGFL